MLATMELTTENGAVLPAPTAEQLRATLDTLSHDNGYAILAREDQHYLQVSGNRFDGYVAEYREGSEDTHHQSAGVGGLTHTQMQNVMAAYLSGSGWKNAIAWQPGMGGHVARRKRTRPGGTRVQAAGALPLLFVIPFLLVGLGATGAAAYLGVDSYRFQQRAVVVPGVVKEMFGHDTQNAIVEYVDSTGAAGRVTSQWASSPPSFDVGERVRVLHDAREPDPERRARIDTWWELWGTSAFAGIFAVAFNGVAIGVLVARRKR